MESLLSSTKRKYGYLGDIEPNNRKRKKQTHPDLSWVGLCVEANYTGTEFITQELAENGTMGVVTGVDIYGKLEVEWFSGNVAKADVHKSDVESKCKKIIMKQMAEDDAGWRGLGYPNFIHLTEDLEVIKAALAQSLAALVYVHPDMRISIVPAVRKCLTDDQRRQPPQAQDSV